MYLYNNLAFIISAICFLWISKVFIRAQENAAVSSFCTDIIEKKDLLNMKKNQSANLVKIIGCLKQQQDILDDTKNNLTFLLANIEASKRKNFIFYNNKVNWTEAAESCAAEGHHLATIRSKEDLDKFKSKLDSQGLDLRIAVIWLGGYDPTNRGKFKWISEVKGQEPKQFNFTNWSVGQPKRTCSVEYEECVQSLVNRKWAVSPCSARNFYACEYHSVHLEQLDD